MPGMLTQNDPRAWPHDPLDRGLVGDWRFDRNTGLVLPDYSGYGAIGTIASGCDWTATQYGPALHLDIDSLTAVSFGTHSQHDLAGTDYTIEVFADLPNDAAASIFEWIDRRLFADGYWINLLTGGRFRIYHRTGGVGDNWTIAGAIQAGIHHYVFTYEPGITTASFYRDGEFISSDPGLNGIGTAAEDLLIESDSTDVQDWLLFRMYRRRLSDAEIRARYQICTARASGAADVWMVPFLPPPVAPVVGQPMQLRGTTVPHLRQWHPRIP